MSLTAVLLLMLAAGAHAGWNLLSKHRMPSAAFFLMATLAGCMALAPAAAAWGGALGAFPLRAWALLAGTGAFMAVYYLGLAEAYRAGDLSVAYPLARAAPVLIVLAVNGLLGRRDQIGIAGVLGMVMVVAGGLLVPLRRWRDCRPSFYLNTTCGWALVAALGTTGYSMFDDACLRLLRQSPEVGLGATQTTLLYAFLEAASSAAWLALLTSAVPRERCRWVQVLKGKRGAAVTTGLAIYGTYALVLLSMAFVRNISYVVAFRQLSIPLGAAFGMAVLREPAPWPKLAGIVLMTIGLILVAVG